MNWNRAYSPPCITARRGGLRHQKKFRVASEADAAGVVFLFLLNRKTTPSSRSTEASLYFIDRSATAPCGGARRGMEYTGCDSHLDDWKSKAASLAARGKHRVEDPVQSFFLNSW